MQSASERQSLGLPWQEFAELLLHGVPGVVSATIEGSQHSVSEVCVWYEPTWPVGEVIEAVQECLIKEARARLAVARFHAVVAQPDRRTEPRARPERTPTTSAGWAGSPDAQLRLVGHKVEEVRPGIVGVEVWIELQGRTFSGAAIGPDVPPGSLRTPALATLRAVHSCVQVLYKCAMQPGLVLESAVQVTVGNSPVAVVALTASENARPRTLTAACADNDASGLAVILAMLQATSRTVTRWVTETQPPEGGGPATTPGRNGAPSGSATERRFTLVDFELDHRPSGDLGVGVRLAGFGEAVERRRHGGDNKTAHLQLSATVTLDAVQDLLRIGGWDERRDGDLRHAGTCRLRTGEQDIVVVLAEALMDGHRVSLAGATSADNGVERASITAMLQATNGLVADPAATMMRATSPYQIGGAPQATRTYAPSSGTQGTGYGPKA